MTPQRKQLLMSHIIDVEGGFVNDPDDSGGATKYGITLATLSKWRGKKCTLNDIFNLKLDEALLIYEKKFLDEFSYSQIESDNKVLVMFDLAAHSGVQRSVMVAQKILGVKIDGNCGPKTLAALNSFSEKVFCREFLQAQQDRYFDIAETRPKDRKFLRGWVIRRVHLVWDKL